MSGIQSNSGQKVFAKGASLILLLLVQGIAEAQPDCRSIIGAYLKPVGNSAFSWAVEGTGAAGIMPDRTIAHWSMYGALDFSKSIHQIYFEGAYKDWYNSAANPDGLDPQTGLPDYNRPSNSYHWGFRELFYRLGHRETFLKFGIQSFKSADYLLFDERMLGLSAQKTLGSFVLTAATGTVSQRLARFQDVCGTRHVYNLFHRSQFNFTGETPFETNFAGVFLTSKPESKAKSAPSSSSADEFDEFSSDEFTTDLPIDEQTHAKVNEWGLFFYEEFGSGFHDYKYYTGAYTTISLPGDFKLKAELAGQYIYSDKALAWWLAAERNITWSNGASTRLEAGYLNKIDLSDDAHFYPAFSNLFMGEILRLDVIDLPMISASVKHGFPGKLKSTVQLNSVVQTGGDHSYEVDLLAGIRVVKHARLTGIISRLNSNLLDTAYWMTKLELKIAF